MAIFLRARAILCEQSMKLLSKQWERLSSRRKFVCRYKLAINGFLIHQEPAFIDSFLFIAPGWKTAKCQNDFRCLSFITKCFRGRFSAADDLLPARSQIKSSLKRGRPRSYQRLNLLHCFHSRSTSETPCSRGKLENHDLLCFMLLRFVHWNFSAFIAYCYETNFFV